MGRRPKSNYIENRMTRALDQLAEYESFAESVAPLLRQAIKEGWDSSRMENDPRIQALLVARQLSIALTEKDTGKALAALKDARDRTTGKPTEKIETTHKLEKMDDKELDALLLSKMGEVDSDEIPDDTLN